jgi:16S rRNA (adenine1518-N6/adenine1519-N6)-dimethyltransferase
MRVSELKAILERAGIAPTKKRGQNFLLNQDIVQREVAFANIKPEDTVLEVGGGTGILTRALAAVAKKVYCIEFDRGLARYLRDEMPNNVEVIKGDALKIDWPLFDKFAANIPYNISSPLTFKLLEHDFKIAAVMYQKEFAERAVAGVGTSNYSRLSVNVYYRARAELMMKVSKGHFYPQPDVDSALVVLYRKQAFSVKDEDIFHKMLLALFNHRRKKISTSLATEWKEFASSKEDMQLAIAGQALPYLDLRPEKLTPEQLGELADALADAL